MRGPRLNAENGGSGFMPGSASPPVHESLDLLALFAINPGPLDYSGYAVTTTHSTSAPNERTGVRSLRPVPARRRPAFLRDGRCQVR